MRKEEELYSTLQSEFDTNSLRHIQGTRQETWDGVAEEVARDSKRYIL